MIIGGTKLYKAALSLADTLYLTFIHAEVEGDTYFPPWNEDEWQKVEQQDFQATKDVPFSYSFVRYEKNV